MYPAKRVIDAFEGAGNLANAIGRDVSRVHRWTYPKERGGTGGAIPGGTGMLRAILAAAKERGITLSLEDLINADPDKVASDVAAKAEG
jgi:hypothetical protein